MDELTSQNNQSKDIYYKRLLENQTNGSLYVEILFEFVNFLTITKEYDLIINVLEKPLKSDFIQTLELRLIITNKLLSILLKVEDFHKLENILDSRVNLLGKEKDLLMQQFYYAVCYEGLNKNIEAIEVLNNIKDNISSANLVNKYLKLSMLNLKIGDFNLAKKHFNTAILYDKNKKNHTFLLAECDLLIYGKNFLMALDIYEDYYIKTSNRYRYLDRYLIIQMGLNNYSDAYNFYQKHLPIMKKVLSKQSRLIFYKTSIALMKKLNNYEEEALLETLVTEIEDSFSPFNNLYDFMIGFVENNYNKNFVKSRDIIHSVFSEIDSTKLFAKLVYAKLDSGLIKLTHYTKGLLLEKNLDVSNDDLNIYVDLKKQEYQRIYMKDDLISFKNDPFLTVKTNYIFVKEIQEFEYMIFYINTSNYYDSIKLFDYASVILKKMLIDYQKHDFNYSLVKNLLNILNNEEYGVFLLKDNNLSLLNEKAKKLLNTQTDYLSMEVFQSHLFKNIYVDELLKNESLTLKYQTDRIIEIEFKILKDNLDIYLIGSEKKEKSIEKKFFDFKYILDEFICDDISILLFNIRSYQDFMKDYRYSRYDKLLNKIYEICRLSSRNYFHNFYLEGMDNLYLILKTKDKRIIKRIYEEVFKTIGNDADIRCSLVHINDKISNDDIEDLKYLNALTSQKIKFLSDNKNYRRNKEVSRTILENVLKIIKENNVRLSYQLIVDWKTNLCKYIYVDVLNRVVLGDKESLKRVVKSNNLENEWDELRISTLVKECRLANFDGKFFVEIGANLLEDQKFLQKIKKYLKNKSFSNSEVIFVIDYEEYLLLGHEYNQKERIAFKNLFNHFKINRINDFKQMDFVFIDNEEMNQDGCKYLLKMIRANEVEIIYNHQKSSLTKSFLSDNEFDLVMGDAYEKYDNLKNLKR